MVLPAEFLPGSEDFAVKQAKFEKQKEKQNVIYKTPDEFKNVRFVGKVLTGIPDQFGKFTLQCSTENPISTELMNFIKNLSNSPDYDTVTVAWDNLGNIKFKPQRNLQSHVFNPNVEISGTVEFMFYFNQKDRKCGVSCMLSRLDGVGQSKIVYSF